MLIYIKKNCFILFLKTEIHTFGITDKINWVDNLELPQGHSYIIVNLYKVIYIV